MNDPIFDLFDAAIDSFPIEHQEAARDWLAKREAAYLLIAKMLENEIDARGGIKRPQ